MLARAVSDATLSNALCRAVIDTVIPFERTNEALACVENGRAKGKVVIQLR